MVGFIIAKIFIPATTLVTGSGGSPEMGDGEGASTQPLLESQSTGFTVIIIVVVIIGLLVGLGYYREKRKK
ncbi:MAG: hypothetical protein GY940_18425 [bacterium]|nr:hypothetical protein [bacterium]